VRRFAVETVGLDLPALAVEFGSRLQAAGVPVGVDRCAGFAQSLMLVRPISRGRLYWTARAAFVTDRSHVTAFNTVFAEVFGREAVGNEEFDHRVASERPAAADEREHRERERGESRRPPAENAADASVAPSTRDETRQHEHDVPVTTVASDEELLRGKRFESVSAAELAELYRLMAQLRIAVPTRSSRRVRQDRHGRHIDVRRTMRASMRSGGDPIHLARRRRPPVPRRIVMLCDISGSMEPYARAYLQFLTSAAGSALRSGGPVEAFVFATRLTRLTRALQSRSPERAIQRAAAAAPDWSSGTRIGEALRRFNDRYGRRGMARGAVIVILSDGWERGDPELVRREMERLSRLAYRIVWVNPRAAAAGFEPKAAGMVAALPYVDALVSGESLAALEEVVRVIGCAPGELPERPWPMQRERLAEPVAEHDGGDESWGSATPVPGSSVAMPSGWSPSRGKTTPRW
jgi:uncharacterized protein with von Willebrand factor type A (vWA) domain